MKINGKEGAIDKNGQQVIPCIFDIISIFRNEYARIELNNMCGVINRAGEVVIPCVASEIYWEYD